MVKVDKNNIDDSFRPKIQKFKEISVYFKAVKINNNKWCTN